MNTSYFDPSSTESLPIFMCLLIDLPVNNVECSEKNGDKCVKCDVRSDYLSGETVDEFNGVGHAICFLLWILTVTIGLCGILGNLMIVAVLKQRSGSSKGFYYLLIVLAFFDLICCIMAVVASTCHVTYHENWTGRGIVLLYVFYLSWISLLFGRTASQFMTVAITIERWLVFAFPFRSRVWFTSTKTKLTALAVLIIAILLSIPRSTSRYVAVNKHNGQDNNNGDDIPCLRNMKYYIRSTSLTTFWYNTLGSVHYQIDFWLPLPLYLIFTFLAFLQVRKMSTERKDLNMSEKKEIQAAEMFLPVVVVLVICNIGPISMFVMVHFFKILYREMYMATIFSICLTSSVNFLIYYFRGSMFRKEADAMLKKLCRFGGKVTQIATQNATTTTSRFAFRTSSAERHRGSRDWPDIQNI